MKKQIRKLLHRFENLKFRKKLSVLMLIAGLVPVGFLAFSMQYGMMNRSLTDIYVMIQKAEFYHHHFVIRKDGLYHISQ